jgi:hypothetical protein
MLRIASLIALVGLSGCYVALSAVEGGFERTINATGPVTLEVSTGSGSIAVKAGSSGIVKIRGSIRARDDWRADAEKKVQYLESNPPIEQSGDVIRIGHIEEPAYRNNISISYEIETPPDTRLTSQAGSGSHRIDGLRGSVNASAGSGSIEISNIGNDVNAQTGSGSIRVDSVTGRTELRTGSGSIRAERISGSIRASTGSGHITLGQSTAEQGALLDVEARTGSGGIEVAGVAGSLQASTGSGSIKAGGNPIGDWRLHTSSGSVSIEVSPDAAFDLYARTASGRINVDQTVEVKGGIGRNELRGKVRGGGRLVEVRTSSGSISVR